MEVFIVTAHAQLELISDLIRQAQLLILAKMEPAVNMYGAIVALEETNALQYVMVILSQPRPAISQRSKMRI
jgi:hypothetical protein